ncbi:CPBP family intramembrane glutamic endopeptidase [Candidatus Neptunochlamydia vexilliferae]|uniref:CPBP family intramembrane glutamic endopeptidase n=1 Tax=Candidatus Neptunichlamydia vexilliferae TaxID=1651774 RepID=UPI00189152AF|nr:CPBP family intramembrane glutamic endopeptidase [Candidatus Neptunochlamydia vexilliferae]
MAERLHFFRLKALPPAGGKPRYPILGLIGYLLIFFLGAPLILRLLRDCLPIDSPAVMMTTLQIVSLGLALLYLFFFSFMQERETVKALWIHPARARFSCLIEDFGLGIVAWLVAFPMTLAVGGLAKLITYIITGKEGADQLAVLFLKLVKDSPSLLVIALVAMVVLAPVIEELVFRGFLYTYLRQKMGKVGALILSSAIFAIFHFAPQQGVSNVPLLFSLFTFSFFLAFLYERQRSLLAPIALHMTFNSISVMRIFLT